MKVVELIDRISARRHERKLKYPPRPTDSRMLVGSLFFVGYYILVFTLLKVVVPKENAPLVRDALLVLGPVVGAIGAALFRTDVRDEIATQNTGAFARASEAQAKATIAAASTTPATNGAAKAAGQVADAAEDEAARIAAGAGVGADEFGGGTP